MHSGNQLEDAVRSSYGYVRHSGRIFSSSAFKDFTGSSQHCLASSLIENCHPRAERISPTPIDPPKSLVVRGPNLLVRNPMYIGVLCVVLGEAAVFHTWRLLAYAFFLALAFHLFVVFYEEPALKKKFGGSYDQYREAVPRWLPKF